jgi:hypothetical protein
MRKKKLFRFAIGEIMLFLRGKFDDLFPNINRAIESELSNIKKSSASVPKK